jgi:hypothetical protein
MAGAIAIVSAAAAPPISSLFMTFCLLLGIEEELIVSSLLAIERSRNGQRR